MLREITVVNRDKDMSIVIGTGPEYDYILQQGDLDVGHVNATHNTFNYPGQIGEFISSTSLGSRDFSVEGYIVGDSIREIERKKHNLSIFVNPLDELEIIAEGYSLFGRPASNVRFATAYKENNTVLCKFLFDVLCNKPMFQKSASDDVELNVMTASFHFILRMVPGKKNGGVIFGRRKKELLAEIANDGAVPIGITIHIIASGTVNNPQVNFIDQNAFIRINKTLTGGEEIMISTVDGERSVKGRKSEALPWESYLDYWDENSAWITLPRGTSHVGFRTSSAGADDTSYENLQIVIGYKPCLFNVDGE